jgi:putative ABC transport system permease protein
MTFVLKLIRKNLFRRPGRTALTILGTASAMFLFIGVESLSQGMDEALSGSDAARTLVVYRLNRYCPQTSFLPERYTAEIAKIPGVQSVLPVKVYLSNCRASLDLVAFQGAPPDKLFGARRIDVIQGDAERFKRERDSALLGKAFADRRHLSPGDKFRFGNITVNVAGIFASGEPVEEGVILTHLDVLQRTGPVNRQGTVTQFEVRIDDPGRSKEISERIDDLFRTAEEPTDTRPRIQFLLDATRDLRELLAFGRIFGIVCVVVVLVLVANTVLMAVQERAREFGVYLTVGYRGRHLLLMVLGETLVLTLAGAALGVALAIAAVQWSGIAIGVEGVSVAFTWSPALVMKALAVALLIGTVAGLAPALRAAQADVVTSLRSA